jgi:hypothetical protein
MNWKWFGRKQLWPNQGTILEFAWRYCEKSWETSVWIVGFLAQILTKHLLIMGCRALLLDQPVWCWMSVVHFLTLLGSLPSPCPHWLWVPPSLLSSGYCVLFLCVYNDQCMKMLLICMKLCLCEVWDSHSGDCDDNCFQGYGAMYWDRYSLTFQDNLLPPSFVLKMELSCTPNTFVNSFKTTWYHSPEDSYLHCHDGCSCDKNSILHCLSLCLLKCSIEAASRVVRLINAQIFCWTTVQIVLQCWSGIYK